MKARHIALAFVAVASLVGTSAARAETTAYLDQNLGPLVYGTPTASAILYGPKSIQTFQITDTSPYKYTVKPGVDSWIGFCIEPTVGYLQAAHYTLDPGQLTSKIQAVFNAGYALVDGFTTTSGVAVSAAEARAGFQAALWEAVTEDNGLETGNLKLAPMAGGNFAINNDPEILAAAKEIYQNYLAGVTLGGGTVEVAVFDGVRPSGQPSQALAFGNLIPAITGAVPEPSTYALFGAGLLAAFVGARRRKA